MARRACQKRFGRSWAAAWAGLLGGMALAGCASLSPHEAVIQQWDHGDRAHNRGDDAARAGDPATAAQCFEEAVRRYTAALRLNPERGAEELIRNQRGQALEKLDRREEAAADFRRALELNPGDREYAERLAALSGERARASNRDHAGGQ